MKRLASIVMLLVVLAATLAACGGAGGTTASPAASTAASTAASAAASLAAEPSVAASTEPSAAASTAASAAASTEASPSAEASAAATSAAGTEETATATATEELPNVAAISDLGTIKIALQGPLSGSQALFGTTARNGAELAIEQLGEQIGFTNLELTALDDQAQEPVGAANANTLAADQDVMCVVGHINSGVALAALPTYRDANLVMISPANTNPRITDDFAGTAYRLVGRDDVQGVVAADFAQNNLQSKNVYVLHDQSAYGEGLATVFRDELESRGITVAGFAGTQETSVFDAVLTPIQAANPDLVFFGGIYDKAGPLLQQMRERGITAKFLGGDGLDSPDLTRLGGEAAVGANYVTVSGPASAYPTAAQFVTDYQAKFNTPASYPAFQGYDATRACLVAIANAAIEANGRPTREQVKAAFADLGTYEGVTGSVTFNDEGDRDPATYFVFEVADADPANWGQNTVSAEIEQAPPQ